MSSERTCNSSSWTKEEDKAFETALTIYSGDSDQFLKIAVAVPGKSLQEIIEHYNVLVEDINDIESGNVPLPKYGRMQSCSSRRSRLSVAKVERRKGIAWTAEEHRLFLQGLEKYGRGDWRNISRNCVLSRTPTQVASHAQKFFSRLNDNNKAKRRRSIHDITSVHAADSGGQLQWPITDYVTEPFDTGMSSLPGPITNCTTGAIEGPSAVNSEKFPVGGAVGSEWNNSFPEVDGLLPSIEDLITVLADGTSGAWRGVDTRTSPSLSLQPSVVGGTGMYSHPFTVPEEGTAGLWRGVDTRTSPSLSLQPSVATGMYPRPVTKVRSLEELMTTKQLIGPTQVGPTVVTASLPLLIAGHMGVDGCTASSNGAKNGFESTVVAPEGGFPVNSMQLPSIGGTCPGSNPSIKDDNIFDLEDLFPDHIISFGKLESVVYSGKS